MFWKLLSENILFSEEIKPKVDFIENELKPLVSMLTEKMILTIKKYESLEKGGVSYDSDGLLSEILKNTKKLIKNHEIMRTEVSNLSGINFDQMQEIALELRKHGDEISTILKNTIPDSKKELLGALDSLIKGDFFTAIYSSMNVIKMNMNEDKKVMATRLREFQWTLFPAFKVINERFSQRLSNMNEYIQEELCSLTSLFWREFEESKLGVILKHLTVKLVKDSFKIKHGFTF